MKRDHPRACGENEYLDHVLRENDGSPPRVRGKRDNGLQLRVGSGITPARAGKTVPLMSIIDA